jgi:hypothetical protein
MQNESDLGKPIEPCLSDHVVLNFDDEVLAFPRFDSHHAGDPRLGLRLGLVGRVDQNAVAAALLRIQ